MWKHYYEKRWTQLGFGLYATVREQYRVSPWNAVLISWDVASAARIFQASRSRVAAEKAIPDLEKAFRRLAWATGEEFDPHRAAVLELEWWQQRREHAPPETYARNIAMLAREIYSGEGDQRVDFAALGRARVMAFRDARGKSGMTDSDWVTVREDLAKSYRLFYEVLLADKRASAR